MQQMKDALKWLNDNQWMNLIFLILALLSIIVSFYLYLKSKKKKLPVYSKRSTKVISDEIHNIEDIEINYHGNRIRNLTVTKIAIWNSGNDTLDYSDQAKNDPLRIAPDDNINIFSAEAIYTNSETSNFKVELIGHDLRVTFDYLDPNQGGIIKIIHSGKSSSDINVCGTFKGCGEIKVGSSDSVSIVLATLLSSKFLNRKMSTQDKRFFAKVMPWIVLAISIGMISGYFFVGNEDKTAKWFLLILGSIYSFLSLAMIFASRSGMPKEFSSFYTDD